MLDEKNSKLEKCYESVSHSVSQTRFTANAHRKKERQRREIKKKNAQTILHVGLDRLIT